MDLVAVDKGTDRKDCGSPTFDNLSFGGESFQLRQKFLTFDEIRIFAFPQQIHRHTSPSHLEFVPVMGDAVDAKSFQKYYDPSSIAFSRAIFTHTK